MSVCGSHIMFVCRTNLQSHHYVFAMSGLFSHIDDLPADSLGCLESDIDISLIALNF